MKLSVIGCGYVGVVHAASMDELGQEVGAVDSDRTRIETLAAGRLPFYEPGFDALLERSLDSGRLQVSSEMSVAAGAQVHFSCGRTPQKVGDFAADLRYVESAVRSLLDVRG